MCDNGQYPIVLAGMGGVARSELVTAVAAWPAAQLQSAPPAMLRLQPGPIMN